MHIFACILCTTGKGASALGLFIHFNKWFFASPLFSSIIDAGDILRTTFTSSNID